VHHHQTPTNAPNGANGIQVQQLATVPLFFGRGGDTNIILAVGHFSCRRGAAAQTKSDRGLASSTPLPQTSPPRSTVKYGKLLPRYNSRNLN